MSSLNEKNLSLAIASLENGESPSIAKAALAFNVNRTTLSRRYKGQTLCHEESHQHLQRLSPPQEKYLTDWIIDLDRRGLPPSYLRVKEMAKRILHESGDDEDLGANWIRGYRKRNPSITSLLGVRLDHKRVDGTQYDIMKTFYDRFHEIQARYKVKPQNIWNVDETGLHAGRGSNGRVLGENRGKKRTFKRDPEVREWVTVIECINAVGGRIRPFVIFKGQEIQNTWFNAESPAWRYTCSMNGWTSNDIGKDWVMNSFLKEAVSTTNHTHSILVMDNHASHTSLEIEIECKLRNVHIIFLPPHSSHILQPLDLSYFGPLKAKCRNFINSISELTDAQPIKKWRFLEAYSTAWNSITINTILSGWSAAGLHPFDPNRGLNSSFMRDLRANKRAELPLYTPSLPPAINSAETAETAETAEQISYMSTPKHQRQLHTMLRLYEKSNVGKDTTAGRALFREIKYKLGRSINASQAEIAQLKDALHQKECELEAQMQKKRKRVRNTDGGRVVEMEDIERVNQELHQKEQEDKARRAAQEAEEAAMNIHTWQLDNY
ncbi:DDE superfamily endonuclease, CENP-B-like protein [Ascosphaera apis ARSEF 7405]|uniref:DDE superfamily endonuclease, CENP-B-like protein n=1 Tax=Ascosphaera apis ARSEF 7405 TaxID=392613 RepID=A0A168BQ18_9EURO|nr:DDE superfamily endonuclease, CENP-B-like protein [Ascosphaera apis ARSEF 7405]